MQIKKAKIQEEITAAAREEFFTHGFKNTSMRAIATKAHVSLSNIYNYFKDKNEIFEAVLSPLLQYFRFLNAEHNKPANITLDIFRSDAYKKEYIRMYSQLIANFRNELLLLLFHAYGSKYENFREDFTDQQMQIGKAYIKLLKEKKPEINTTISDFFIHTVSSWQISMLSEIVFHNLPDTEVEQILDNCFTFTVSGWEKLLQP